MCKLLLEGIFNTQMVVSLIKQKMNDQCKLGSNVLFHYILEVEVNALFGLGLFQGFKFLFTAPYFIYEALTVDTNTNTLMRLHP